MTAVWVPAEVRTASDTGEYLCPFFTVSVEWVDDPAPGEPEKVQRLIQCGAEVLLSWSGVSQVDRGRSDGPSEVYTAQWELRCTCGHVLLVADGANDFEDTPLPDVVYEAMARYSGIPVGDGRGPDGSEVVYGAVV